MSLRSRYLKGPPDTRKVSGLQTANLIEKIQVLPLLEILIAPAGPVTKAARYQEGTRVATGRPGQKGSGVASQLQVWFPEVYRVGV